MTFVHGMSVKALDGGIAEVSMTCAHGMTVKAIIPPANTVQRVTVGCVVVIV